MSCKWCALGECWTHAGGKGGKAAGNGAKVAVAGQQKQAVAQTQQKKATPKAVPQKPEDILAHVVSLFQENFMSSAGPSPDTQWRGKLNQELQKNGIEKPTYASEASPDGKGWVGTATLNGQVYTAKASAISKKAAEVAAAKAAFEALYPEAYKSLSPAIGAAGMLMGLGGGPAKGQKRKAEQSDHPKSKLMSGVQLMILNAHGRSVTKDDITYAVAAEQQEGTTPPKYMATVTIAEYDGGKSFSGEWCESKPKAEASAAEAAYKVMGEMLGALEEEHAAKKKAKYAKQLEELKAKTAAKKEAQKANMAA